MTHGTITGYAHWKCRCVTCKTAWRDWFREYRARPRLRPVAPEESFGRRLLNARWVAAGRRRIVARELRAEGRTFAQIGKALGVSAEQARRDCGAERTR